MPPRALCAFLVLLPAAPAFAQEGGALLVVADDGALEAPAVHAIRTLAQGELQRRGISVVDDPRTQGRRPLDASLSQLALQLGAGRLFALSIGGMLGQKVPLTFEELSPQTLAPVSSASLVATGLDECDVVTARLVDAVLERRSAGSTARMGTVTAAESKPFAQRPGQRFWFVGLPVALYNANRGTPLGICLGYGYEAENFRLGASVGSYSRDSEGVSYLLMEGVFIPFASEISPFVGGGLGYMGAGSRAGMGAEVEVGLEAFRLHGVRALLGLQAMVPFFNTQGPVGPGGTAAGTLPGRNAYPAGFVRFGF